MKCDSQRPSWGKNVLRGLSNKCLMRGTFRAILFFVRKHVLAYWEPENVKIQKTRFYEFGVFSHFFVRTKNPVFGTPNSTNSGFSPKTTKIMFFHDFYFHKIKIFVKNIKFKMNFIKLFNFIKILLRILSKHFFHKKKNNVFPINLIFILLKIIFIPKIILF